MQKRTQLSSPWACAMVLLQVALLMTSCDKDSSTSSGGSGPVPVAVAPPPPPPPSLNQILVGRWYRSYVDGPYHLNEIMAFDEKGNLEVSQSSENQLQNVLTSALGKIHCSWSVQDNVLIVEIVGADRDFISLARTGQIAHIHVSIESPKSIVLSKNIVNFAEENDNFTRLK